jgi:hypothetical protein
MQQSNIYLGIYIIKYYFFWKNQGVTTRHERDSRLAVQFLVGSQGYDVRVCSYIVISTHT